MTGLSNHPYEPSLITVFDLQARFDMISDFKPTLTEEERAYARALMLALEPFRHIRSTMPLQYVYTFLMVATDEGKGGTEYAQKAGVSNTVMTRHLLDIGDRNRALEQGFGLITQERDKEDLRRHHARVTPTGKALLNKIVNALKTAPASEKLR
jgi:hypothetical protein